MTREPEPDASDREPDLDPAEPWEPAPPEPSPGPERIPKDEDPGPDA